MPLATLILITAVVADSPLKITNEPLCPGQISPMQYGQFIEYLCDLVPSMWAEKLYDGSFEGLSPYKGMEYLKQTDFKEKPWYPSGATNRAEFRLDSSNPVHGKTCQKITVKPGAPATVGISQDGIFLDPKACDFRCYLRQEGSSGPVTVSLSRDGQIIESCKFKPTNTWRQFSTRFYPKPGTYIMGIGLAGVEMPYADISPLPPRRDVTLTISFRGPGTLWLDLASLMPEDTVGGWRRDVFDAIRALKPEVIRFGGSALDDKNLGEFEWRDSVGPVEKRKPFRAWGGLQPFAAGLEEIVQLCKAVDAEPLICVRFTDRTPKDAADEVEYFNGPSTSPQGALRARNGHAQPYGIKYWQIGNELGGPKYEAGVAAFCEAMKKADPSIKLLSSYPNEGVFRKAGQFLDYACPHHYGCGNLKAMADSFAEIRAMLKRVAPDRPIKIAVTEWNTTGGHAGPQRAMLWSLANALACSRYHNLMHRNADIVEIANRSNLTNSFCSGIIQTNNRTSYKTPTYYAQQLYATQAGNRPLHIEGLTPESPLDVSATLSENGNEMTLLAVNDTLEPIERTLDVSAFPGRNMTEWKLTEVKQAGEPDVANSFAEPERVIPVKKWISNAGEQLRYRFEPLSLTVLQWRK
jgi:alpha-N-arabinofuranosidase